MKDRPKVFVGVSGGVDSSVSLALLKEQGYDVTGVFLKVWHPDFLPCDWKEERRSAMRVCATLNVPFLIFDFEKEYKKEVVDYMLREYKAGRVPNPDVFCNKYVKFGVFLDKALEMRADYIATGHYAMIAKGEHSFSRVFGASEPDHSKKNVLLWQFLGAESSSSQETASLLRVSEKKNFLLQESIDKEKDQSYFLYTLNQKQLSHTLFPVGGMTKPEVRNLAKKFNLPTAEKKDSQGLCFIGKVDMKDFLSHYIKTEKGNVLDTKGEIIGNHEGSIFYAIGQRHGFTITKKTGEDPRYFVVSKNLEQNTITVASKGEESDKVYSTNEIFISDIHFISGIEPKFPLEVSVKIRYRQEKQECRLEKKKDGYYLKFKNLQNGISVGQSAVFYDQEICIGGGIIEKVI